MRKEIIALFLTVCMTAVLLAACGVDAPSSTTGGQSSQTSSGSGGETDDKTDGLPQPGDFGEQVELTWLAPANMTEYTTGSVEEILLEKFNVKLTAKNINGGDDEKLMTALVAGEIPDVMVRWNAFGLWQQGVIQEVDMDMVAQYMPESKKVFDSYSAAWPGVTDVDGTIYALPSIRVVDGAPRLAIVRQDWLDAVDAKMPSTLDEWTEVLRKFTEEDPDGNGADDTYGMTMRPAGDKVNFYSFNPSVFGAFGINGNKWVRGGDGLISYGAVTEGFRDGLKQIRAWYEAGYIDPDWSANDDAMVSSKMYNGQAGLVDGSYNPQYLDSLDPNGILHMSKEHNPNAEWKFVPPPVGPNGKSGSVDDGVVFSWSMMFGANASKTQIARAMQVAEAINMDPEMYMLVGWGVEGEHYDMNENGVPVRRPDTYLQPGGAGAYNTFNLFSMDLAKQEFSDEVITLFEENLAYTAIRDEINVGSIEGSKTDDDKINIDETEMDKLIQEFTYRAVFGDVDIDAEWEAYVQKWNDLGGARKTEIARTLPIIQPVEWK